MAHKKFKVSETQLKLFYTRGQAEGSELTQNRDKHTCTTHTPTHTHSYRCTGREKERERDRNERQEVST